MPFRKFDWQEHLKDIEREYWAVRFAVDRANSEINIRPDLLKLGSDIRKFLRRADGNLEGTYLVRPFAAFEAALRSYDRARFGDPARDQDSSWLINNIGGRRGQGISAQERNDAHAVRQLRNRWAHEGDEPVPPMPIAEARRILLKFLSRLPERWG